LRKTRKVVSHQFEISGWRDLNPRPLEPHSTLHAWENRGKAAVTRKEK
jgi:hypothetical protein